MNLNPDLIRHQSDATHCRVTFYIQDAHKISILFEKQLQPFNWRGLTSLTTPHSKVKRGCWLLRPHPELGAKSPTFVDHTVFIPTPPPHTHTLHSLPLYRHVQTIHPHVYRTAIHKDDLDYESSKMFCFCFQGIVVVPEVHSFTFSTHIWKFLNSLQTQT